MGKQFENPLIPMGALTGRPTRERLRKILAKYREAGIEQYLIYPRSGCELEYLSDEYLDTIAVICEEAEGLGFTSIWLYDEFNWPSGSCAHRVPRENPDLAMRFVCAFREGDEIKVEVRRNPDYTDLMDPAAVDRFIALTHERYYARLAPWFGKLVKGIFTDEPEIGYFGEAGRDALFCMGYYEGLERDYRELTGGELFSDIAAGVRSDPDFYPAVCAKLLAGRFRASYIDRVQAWCEAHGVVLTGHLMNETSPFMARKSNGRILNVLSGMGLPGMDEIATRGATAEFEWLTLGSCMHAVERRGNRGGLAELFALGPCDLSFARLSKMLWLTGAFGVDHYVLAIAPVDARGCAMKPKWYNSFSLDQPHLEVFPVWAEEARRAARLAGKERSYEIGVRYGKHAERLPDLLEDLTRHQLSWCLLGEEEEAPESLPMVLSLLPEGFIREEKCGSRGANFDFLWDVALRKKLCPGSLICDADGGAVEDVFVRRYRDGGLLTVDMSGRSRELFLLRNGQRVRFFLYAHGAAEFPGWQLEFDRPHLLRAQFDGTGRAELELPEPQILKLALRQYGGAVEAEWDGRVLSGGAVSGDLPEVFNGLYREVELGEVPAGKHVLQLRGDAPEYPFLPRAVWSGGGLPDYVGKVVQKAVWRVPENALKMRFAAVPEPGAAELLLDGVSLGRRLHEPYEWILPETARGEEKEIALVRWSSVGGLFGEPWPGDDEFSRWSREHRAPRRRKITALEFEFV